MLTVMLTLRVVAVRPYYVCLVLKRGNGLDHGILQGRGVKTQKFKNIGVNTTSSIVKSIASILLNICASIGDLQEVKPKNLSINSVAVLNTWDCLVAL